jgi:hypothetical protein
MTSFSHELGILFRMSSVKSPCGSKLARPWPASMS